MSAIVDEPQDASLATILGDATNIPRWLQVVDRLATRAGDAINPILIKETRQALKSRQFVVTFSLLLFAALAWTIAGSLLLMPQIYFVPSGPTLLTGYYLVLAVPMLLVVPLAAYRSLEGEIDDGTLELLSVTSLSPRQIVFGKLGSAALQMMLYFVALFPCVAYAYTLRGVDLPTLAILMLVLVVFGLTLTVVGIFFAPMARARSSQVSTLLVVMLILFAGEFAAGSLAISLIQEGNPLTASLTNYLVVSGVLIATTLAYVLLMATAAQLTPESENRSTSIRVALLIHEAVLIGIAAYGLVFGYDIAMGVLYGIAVHTIVTWVAVGAMMSAEASTMTPRIRRELPATFFSRLMLIWLTPGPATGFVFAASVLAVSFVGIDEIFTRAELLPDRSFFPFSHSTLRNLGLLFLAYYCVAMVGVRFIISVLRIKNVVRVGIGLAALAVISLLMAIVPYSIGLHLNDYRQYEYSLWQVSNWVWTLQLAAEDRLDLFAFQVILALGGIAFFGHLLLVGRTVLPQRLVTPERVLEERRRMKPASESRVIESDPLGLSK
jgi:ABC-type transport system involved in cytochrome c biogenesis permease component